MMLFEVKHHFLAVHDLLTYLAKPHDTKGYGLVNNHLDAFFLNVWDSFPHVLQTANWIVAAILLVPTFFFVLLEKNKQLKYVLVYFFMLVGITLFVLSFLRNHIFMYYLLDLNLVYIFFFVYILKKSFEQKNKLMLGIFTFFFLAMVVYGTIDAYPTTKHNLPDYGGVSKMRSHTDAIDYIYKMLIANHLVFLSSPQMFLPTHLITRFYGMDKIHIITCQIKK